MQTSFVDDMGRTFFVDDRGDERPLWTNMRIYFVVGILVDDYQDILRG